MGKKNSITISAKKPPVPSIIDDNFEQELFELWISGLTFTEISKIFEKTPRKFSIMSLSRAARRYRWKQRRDMMLGEADINKDKVSKALKQKAKAVVGVLMSLSQGEIARYLQDPTNNPRPGVMPDTITELDKLLRLFYFVDADGMDKQAIGILADVKLDVDDATAKEMLRVLSNASTRKLMTPNNNEVIEAEVSSDVTEDGE